MARRRQSGSRRYPRTARLNELVREIVAEEIERIDDERLGFFTVTAVEVDPGLEHAKVLWTPVLTFHADEVERSATRIEEILRDLDQPTDEQ